MTFGVERITSGIAERAAEYDQLGQFPAIDFEEIKDSGLLGLMVPERLGGMGGMFSDYVEVAMQLGQANGATALIYNMHTSITGGLAHTSDAMAQALGAPQTYFEARDELLRRAANGSLFSVAMSERGAGSRLSNITTTYEQTSTGFHIKGEKAFVSGAGHGDFYLVAARSNEADDISQFVIPAGDGITINETWDSMGMRATGSHDVVFDIDVDASTLLGGIEGLALPLAQLMPQWLVASYAAVYVGVAQGAINAAVQHAKSRGTSHLPMVRARVGRADASVAAAAALVREAARLVDSAPGEPSTNQAVYRAKLMAGDTAVEVAASMLEAAGTAATRKGNALERIYRDARCGALHPATSDVCADWLGVSVLGEDPELSAAVSRW